MTQPEQTELNSLIPKTVYGKVSQKARPVYWVSLFLILSILTVYGQLHDYPFITLDDPTYVKDNPHIRDGMTVKGIYWSLKSVYASNWHPLTWISHMMDVELYGMDAGRHHMTNTIIHILNSLLLLFTLNRFTGRLWPSSVVAALFALHPINVETVAWVAQRKTLLCFFFWLLALRSYYGYVQRPQTGRYVLVLLFFILGMMSKPAIVVFPFILMLLDYWPLARYQSHKSAHKPGMAMGLIGPIAASVKGKIPFFVITVAGCVLTYVVQKSGGAVTALDILPLNVRIANALLSYAAYLGKAFWPHNLAILYPYPDAIPVWHLAVSTVLLGFISLWAIKTIRKHPYVIVGWLWYLLILVPVIGIVQVGIQAMADRYASIPLVGIFIILVWGVSDVSSDWDHRKTKLGVLAIIPLLFLMATTWKQAQTWRNSVTVFRQALSVSADNYSALNNMGFAFSSQNRIDDAVKYYSMALRINPDFEDARFNLGVALFLQGKYGAAIEQYTRALQLNPLNAKAYNNLGAAMATMGNESGAVRHYKSALRLDSNYADAHRNLANIYFAKRIMPEAEEHYRSTIRINPHDKHARNNLGLVLVARDELDAAIHQFTEALRIDGNFTEAHHNLKLTVSRREKKQ